MLGRRQEEGDIPAASQVTHLFLDPVKSKSNELVDLLVSLRTRGHKLEPSESTEAAGPVQESLWMVLKPNPLCKHLRNPAREKPWATAGTVSKLLWGPVQERTAGVWALERCYKYEVLYSFSIHLWATEEVKVKGEIGVSLNPQMLGTTEEKRCSGRLVPEMSLVQLVPEMSLILNFVRSHRNSSLLDGVSAFKCSSQRRNYLYKWTPPHLNLISQIMNWPMVMWAAKWRRWDEDFLSSFFCFSCLQPHFPLPHQGDMDGQGPVALLTLRLVQQEPQRSH